MLAPNYCRTKLSITSISLDDVTGSSPAAEKEENRLGLDANAETPLQYYTSNKCMR
jgi:hypothetical protein